MKAFFSTFPLLLIFLSAFTANAQPLQKAENLLANKTNSQWSFEENRGQLADENGEVLSDIKYYGIDKGVAIYLRQNKISFVFSKTEIKNIKPQFSEATGTAAASLAISPPSQGGVRGGFGFPKPEEITISTSRIDLELAGANKNAQIVAEEKISYYTNYYLAHTPEEGITHVPHYKKITYKNIYNNIDLVLHVKEQGLKYDFVVHPKGKVSDIKLLWNGTKPDVLQVGGIKYASLLGEIMESKPFSYVSENKKEVKSKFKVKGNVVGFDVESYDESKVLVIDPMLVWGTYHGGMNSDFGEGICSDNFNKIYIVGLTSSPGLGTSGTHQDSYNGTYVDGFIAKFNSDGKRLWATYYGGELGDHIVSISVDKRNDFFVTGTTSSKSGIATQNAFKTTFRTVHLVAFIAKFNDSGLRQWGTYYGGEALGQFTRGNKIACDGYDDVIVVGNTSDNIDIATNGTHQASVSRVGGDDAFVVKFNTNGTRLWGTYYGGDRPDYGYGITVDGDNNIYLSGNTLSTDNIATPGAHEPTHGHNGGIYYSFLAKLNSQGTRQWGTYYGAGYSYGICVDNTNNIILSGHTSSTTGIATSGAYQANLAGLADAYIAKFNADGKRLWGTYFGGEADEFCSGITMDKLNNIYITGYTQSTANISSKDAYQETHGGGTQDAFMAIFNSSGTKLWSSYYGGPFNDLSKGIICQEGNIYIVGNTSSSSAIATLNAHQVNKHGMPDAFLAKFNRADDAGVAKIVEPLDNSCGGIINVLVKIKNYNVLHDIESVIIGWSVNGIKQAEFNWQGSLFPGDTSVNINIGVAKFLSGTNFLKVWTDAPNGGFDPDNNNDTLTKTIFVLPTPEAKTGENKSICIGDSASIGADAVSGNIYQWKSNPPGFNSSQSKLTLTPTITTTYYLKETDTTSGCSAEDSVTITVYPIPEPEITGDTFICGQGTATFEINNNNSSSTYTWEVEGGNISSGQATNKIEIKLNRTTSKGKVKVTEHNPGSCYGVAEQEFIYNYTPLVDLGPDQYICEDFGNLVKLDAGHGYITYRWYPTGDTTQWLEVRKVNDYYVVVTDKCGNELKDEVRIESNCPVTIYIPNAFTPNNDIDNLNEVFRPLIENVVEYNFTIYNRWGEKIFISKDYNTGWDGNCLGKSVPEGVYLYMIECTVKEGAISRKLNKTGTVQLLR